MALNIKLEDHFDVTKKTRSEIDRIEFILICTNQGWNHDLKKNLKNRIF